MEHSNVRTGIHAEESSTTRGEAAAFPGSSGGVEESLRFADCEVRVASREIVRGGTVQKVERLTFDLIVYLISNRGRVISKDELLRAVWRNMFVSDSVITQGVMKARRVLADDGRGRAFIRTVHRVGYKFNEQVLSAPAPTRSAHLPAAELILVARQGHLDEVGRQALARATEVMARELARVGLALRRLDSDQFSAFVPGASTRLELDIDAFAPSESEPQLVQ